MLRTLLNTDHTLRFALQMSIERAYHLLQRRRFSFPKSFDHPTDVLLIGQFLGQGQRLAPAVTSSNFSSSVCYISLDLGSLVAFVEGERPTRYLNWQSCQQENPLLKYIVFGLRQIAVICESSNGTSITSSQTTLDVNFQFLRSDSDGGLRIYSWENSTGWNIVYSRTELNECQVPLKCGKYGVCQGGQCSCPVGVDGVGYFGLVYNKFPHLGCHQISQSQSASGPYELVDFGSLSYFSSFNEESAFSERKEICLQACRERKSCKAAFFKFEDASSEGLCYWPSEVLSIIGCVPRGVPSGSYHSSSHIKISTTSAVQLAPSPYRENLNLLLLNPKCIEEQGKKNPDGPEQVPEVLLRFSFGQLCVAIKNFSEKLGSGGYGKVFKGKLKDGTAVAVKQLNSTGQGNKRVSSRSGLHSNGSLDKWLFDDNKSIHLDWKTRKKIVLDIAKALAYLHDCSQRIAHFDFKPQNILLDEKFNAKLSDFGISVPTCQVMYHRSPLVAQPSKFVFPANTSTTWINNDESIPLSKHFEDGSMAPFILLQQSNPVYYHNQDFGFGCCFYCSPWANSSCYLTATVLEMTNGADGTVVWSANTSGQSVYCMELEISGNWIIYGQSSVQGVSILWQSFKYHTDILLLWQDLGEGQHLTSGISNSNSSSGLFYLSLESGSLVAFVDGRGQPDT
ncbi:Protein kinase domain [Dillenia turbinata]|uniref:non-specific serine/threonine protein kinase n=1 Tax=Dillenia turbinata TaxID=194707 RepID=A0AAN8VNF5_9MAGN